MKLPAFLFREILPDRHAKYVYMMAGATVGGIIFAVTQSWTWAITYDITTALTCWAVFKFTEPLLASLARAFRRK